MTIVQGFISCDQLNVLLHYQKPQVFEKSKAAANCYQLSTYFYSNKVKEFKNNHCIYQDSPFPKQLELKFIS